MRKMVNYIQKKSDKFYPSAEMKKIAWIKDSEVYREAEKNPVKFWEKLAEDGIDWQKKWDKAYVEKLPYFEWFKGGELNFCYNCLDRHLKHRADKTALIWIPESVKEKKVELSYRELFNKVKKFANILKKYNVKKGDVVAIYMPMIPEALVAMLACTRIGAVHSVVFSAFSADALKARIDDGKAKILITADGYYRKGEKEYLIKKARKAVRKTSIEKIIVVPRFKKRFRSFNPKFLDFNKEISKVNNDCKCEKVKSEDIMFILYTSGTTGKPKGIVHDTGGYAVQAYWTAKWNFNLHDDDIMWCTADVGWITGHSYAFYGPLLNGSTTLIYEGSPDFPNPSRWWKIIEKNNVSVFYTAPTAIRMFRKFGDKYVNKFKMKSLKILGTVGEPIDKESWMWFFKKIGHGKCPVIDTWWQTETGGTLINSLPGVGPFVPTVAGKSFPGTRHFIVDEKGVVKKKGQLGFLIQTSPFAPGMLHGVYKNHKKYVETYWNYWKKFRKKYYDTSDGGVLCSDGLIRITGRTDDVMKVAGHRLATAELEDAISSYKRVSECAVVPVSDKIKGQVPVAFCVLKNGYGSEKLQTKIKKHVDLKIGPTARPAKIYFVNDLPKTRSGKIMRRILKNLLNNEKPEGLMTLVNPESVDEIKGIIKNSNQIE